MSATIKTALVVLVWLSATAANASMVTIDFDVSLIKKIDAATQQPVAFDPLYHLPASIRFDNIVTSVDRYTSPDNPIMRHVTDTYGTPADTVVSSPLEPLTDINLLVNAQEAGTSSVQSILWYSFDPTNPSTVSFGHSVGASSSSFSTLYKSSTDFYAAERWSRHLYISGPVTYLGAFDQAALNRYDFSTESLMAYFETMLSMGSEFTFSDGYSYTNYPTQLVPTGYTWTGTAVITRIEGVGSTEVPEPSMSWLMSIGLMLLAFKRNAAKRGNRGCSAGST